MSDTGNLDTHCPVAIRMPADGPEDARMIMNGKQWEALVVAQLPGEMGSWGPVFMPPLGDINLNLRYSGPESPRARE